ncbi:MAG: IS3 family transposase [Candidatus Magasanikbacteria bacterium]|nr:IS3 family transposase [Candidatus Magasanikbacteria bacterium]
MTHREKLLLVEKEGGDISLTRQCELLGVSRASVYYQPVVNQADIRIMGFIDKIYTDYPFYGSRRIRYELNSTYDSGIGRDHIRRLMRIMGIEAIYPRTKPNTSAPNQQHQKYPYLLKGLPIIRPNQVWGTDITYVKLERGFAYLIAFIDWFSRYVISWELSETLEIDFCLIALETALSTAIPEISNTDQGSHFTSDQFLNPLRTNGVKISMDGRGRCMDNIFTERLWRTLKYENIFLKSYKNMYEAKPGISEYFQFYNTKRPHQALGYKTPADIYFQ